jgi:hypothetical protein
MRNLQKYLSYILIEGYFNIVSTHNGILKCELYIKIPKQLVMPRVYKHRHYASTQRLLCLIYYSLIR